MEIEQRAKLRRKEDVIFREIAGEGVLLDQGGREVLGLNPSGAEIIRLIDGGLSPAEILARLASEKSLPVSEIEAEVLSFLDELMASGILLEAE